MALDLSDPLPSHTPAVADLLECVGLVVVETEAPDQHFALAFRQQGEELRHQLLVGALVERELELVRPSIIEQIGEAQTIRIVSDGSVE